MVPPPFVDLEIGTLARFSQGLHKIWVQILLARDL